MEWPSFERNDVLMTLGIGGIMGVIFLCLGKFFDAYNIAEQTFRDIIVANASIVFVIPVVSEFIDSAFDDNDYKAAYLKIPTQSYLLKTIIGMALTFAIVYTVIVIIGAQTITPGLLIVAIFYAIYHAVPETGDDMLLLAFWIGSVATAILCGWLSPGEWIEAQMFWLTTIWEWIQGHASMALGAML